MCSAVVIKREKVESQRNSEGDQNDGSGSPRVIEREIVEFPPFPENVEDLDRDGGYVIIVEDEEIIGPKGSDEDVITRAFTSNGTDDVKVEESPEESAFGNNNLGYDCHVGVDGFEEVSREPSLLVEVEDVQVFQAKEERLSYDSQESLPTTEAQEAPPPKKLTFERMSSSRPLPSPILKPYQKQCGPVVASLLRGKTKSVVQTLANRELGIPFVSRAAEMYGCNVNGSLIERQLLTSEERQVEWRDTSKNMEPRKVGLNHKGSKKNAKSNDDKRMQEWVQILVPPKTQIGITDSYIWLRQTGHTRDKQFSQEEFYSVECSSSNGFKLISRICSSGTSFGKLKLTDVVSCRGITPARMSTYFVTLTESGHLRAFDLVLNKVSQEIRLTHYLPKARYAEADVCEESGRIWIMAEEKTLVKTVLVLSYPPWTKIDVIHIDIPLKMALSSQVCFLFHEKSMKLTTWPHLMKAVQVTKPGSRDNWAPTDLLPVRFEGILSKLPLIFAQSKFHTEDDNSFGIMNLPWPMFYGTYKSGIKFFLPLDFARSLDQHVYEFSNAVDYDEDPAQAFPFPDNSSRALISAPFSGKYEVVSFKVKEIEVEGSTKKTVEVTNKSQPFNQWDISNHRLPPSDNAPAESPRKRLERACTKKDQFDTTMFNKRSVFGLEYSAHYNLLGVLTADNEEFQVVLYEPMTLEVVRILPPVLAWPEDSISGEENKKRELIEEVEFVLDQVFCFISFKYPSNCKPSAESYLFRFLTK